MILKLDCRVLVQVKSWAHGGPVYSPESCHVLVQVQSPQASQSNASCSKCKGSSKILGKVDDSSGYVGHATVESLTSEDYIQVHWILK